MKFNFKLNDINYVKILYKTSNGNFAHIRAGLKDISEREIIASSKYSDNLNIETPQDIILSFVCNDGIYRTKTVLKSAENDEPYVFFIMETPKNVEYEQNREYFRVLADYKCIYKVNVDGEIKEFTTNVFDISANGISITLPQHIISEKSAELNIYINNKIISTKIHYVRSEKIKNDYKLSFAFSKISENDRNLISQVCLQKQLEHRRNHIK